MLTHDSSPKGRAKKEGSLTVWKGLLRMQQAFYDFPGKRKEPYAGLLFQKWKIVSG